MRLPVLPMPQAQKGEHRPRENLRTCVVVIAHEFGDKEADRWNELCVELPDLLVVLGIGLALNSHVTHHSEGEFVEYMVVYQCLVLVGELQPASESVGRSVRAGSTPAQSHSSTLARLSSKNQTHASPGSFADASALSPPEWHCRHAIAS